MVKPAIEAPWKGHMKFARVRCRQVGMQVWGIEHERGRRYQRQLKDESFGNTFFGLMNMEHIK